MALQFRVSSLALAVCAFALLMTSCIWIRATGLPFGWWDVKAYTNLAYFPLAAWTIVRAGRSRCLHRALIFSGTLTLMLWLALARPAPCRILLGEWPMYPISALEMWLIGNSGSRFVVNWFASFGTILDAVSLLYAVFMLSTSAKMQTRTRALCLAAMLLCFLRVGDWMMSGRLIGSNATISCLNFDHAPVRLFRDWKEGHRRLPEIVHLLKWEGVSEFLAPSLMLAYLLKLCVRSGGPFAPVAGGNRGAAA
jgi:hypothetical protein